MRRTKSSHILLLLLIATVLVPISTVLAEKALEEDDEDDGENLLDNPSFEGNYKAWDDPGDIKVAPDWIPWYVEGSEDDQADGYGRRPSYYWASEKTDPGSTHDGELAQYWKNAWGAGAGGVYQQVAVPKDSKLRLSVWVRTSTCQPEEEKGPCVQQNDGWVGAQIAIDPEGGEDFYADSVVFTDAIVGTSNKWEELILDADAPGSEQVTVFLMYYPDFPRQENKMWVDDASLTVIGAAESGGKKEKEKEKEKEQETSPFVTPQPPQADGSIVHTVQKGENLSSIAVAYYNQGYTDITVPKIKELNNLKSDIIIPGQKLTIVPAGGAAAPAAEATEEPEEEQAKEEEEEEATPEPTEVAASTTGEVCMSLFEDANANTLQDPSELLLAGGTLTLSSSTGVPENYTTDGATEPHCFTSLVPGEYIASATTPFGYEMTTVSSWSIQVDPSAQLDLTFGAVSSGEGGTAAEGVEEESSGGGFFSNIGRVLIGVSGLLVLLIAGGLGAYFLVFKRS